MRRLSSKFLLEKVDAPTPIPDSSLYVDVNSIGFSVQHTTFYNPSSKSEEIDLSNYYLQPNREDIQRIGIAGRANGTTDLFLLLEDTLYPSMARLSLGFTPILGDVADLYEFLTGRDFVRDQTLTWDERLLSGIAIIAGSGVGYRYASRLAFGPKEFLAEFEKSFREIAGKGLDFAGKDLRVVKNLIQQTHHTKQAIRTSPTLRNQFERQDFKRTDFYARQNGEIIPAKAYRYISSNAPYLKQLSKTGSIPSRTDGNYISFTSFKTTRDAAARLQVPHDARIKVEFDTKQVLEDIRIPRGNWGKADWLEPIAKDHPQFGHGGAYQAITNQSIRATRVVDLMTSEILYERK